jgi:REP element-mobilizing transposase RayT
MISDPSFHRRSIRLMGYDYTQAGAYFVTMVTYQRQCLFGEVVNGEMQINSFGGIVKEEWFHTATLRSYVHLFTEEFVVMPNHIHGIIWIDDIEMEIGRGAASLRPYARSNNVTPNSLGAIVRGFKSAVTYRINALRNSRGTKVWQRNYYEHIIRVQSEMDDIAAYILVNPIHWPDDSENIH